MKEINIARTLMTKRREKGITQDELAEYIGVSKASVSKWETGQSYPDITFLPQLAAYFNITIDELIGYEPQMEKEDIKKLYQRLAAEFAEKPFEDVLSECMDTIRKYYSCFPLLQQMAVLLINHHMLADSADKQKEILREALELCRKVKSESEDVLLSMEAVHLEAACRLILQEPNAVLDLLGEEARPIQSDIQLIGNAYQLLGNVSKAQEFTQIGMYQHLLLLQDFTPTYLMLYAADAERTDEVMRRAMAVADAYNLDKLHPNVMLQIYLAAAGAYCMQGNQEKALDMLRKYTDICVSDFFPYRLHRDDFFDKLEGWFESFSLGSDAPRSEKLIKESMVQGLSNPLFAALAENPQYKTMLEKLKLHSGNN